MTGAEVQSCLSSPNRDKGKHPNPLPRSFHLQPHPHWHLTNTNQVPWSYGGDREVGKPTFPPSLPLSRHIVDIQECSRLAVIPQRGLYKDKETQEDQVTCLKSCGKVSAAFRPRTQCPDLYARSVACVCNALFLLGLTHTDTLTCMHGLAFTRTCSHVER